MGWFDENGYDEASVRDRLGSGLTTQPPINNNAPATPTPATTPTPSAMQQARSAQLGPQGPSSPSPIANVDHNGTTSGGLNREQWRDKWLSTGQTDMAGLQSFLAQNGGKLLSDNGTVETPFGDTLDIGAGARTGKITPAWTQVGAPSDGPGGSGGGFPGGNMSLGALGSSMPSPGPFAPANMSADAFRYDQAVPAMERLQTVKPPTQEELQNDPAYQFRLKQGIGALQNSAAARGSVRDANVWKGLMDYGQEAASQEADRITNRNLATTGANNAAISGNNAAALGAHGQGFGQALSTFNANLGALGQSQQYGLGLGNLALGNKQADNSYSLGQGQLGLGRDQFGLQQQGQYWNQAFNNNAQQWDQYYKLAQLGYPQS